MRALRSILCRKKKSKKPAFFKGFEKPALKGREHLRDSNHRQLREGKRAWKRMSNEQEKKQLPKLSFKLKVTHNHHQQRRNRADEGDELSSELNKSEKRKRSLRDDDEDDFEEEFDDEEFDEDHRKKQKITMNTQSMTVEDLKERELQEKIDLLERQQKQRMQEFNRRCNEEREERERLVVNSNVAISNNNNSNNNGKGKNKDGLVDGLSSLVGTANGAQAKKHGGGGGGGKESKKQKKSSTQQQLTPTASTFNIFDDTEFNFPSPPSSGGARSLADDFFGTTKDKLVPLPLPGSSLKPILGKPLTGKPAAMAVALGRGKVIDNNNNINNNKKKKKGPNDSMMMGAGASMGGGSNNFMKMNASQSLASKMLPPPKKGQMEEIVRKLQKFDKLKVFAEPVTEAIAPGYFQMVDRPMDLATIRKYLREKKHYFTWEMFEADCRLMYTNCQSYNGPHSPYYEVAQQGLREMRKLIHEKIIESLEKKKGFNGSFDMSSVFPMIDVALDFSRPQSELLLSDGGGGDFSRDNSDDENDGALGNSTVAYQIQQKKKNRETFKAHDPSLNREPFEKRCPTMQVHCDNQLLQAYRYKPGPPHLVNYSNNVARMAEKPYEVFPPLGRNVSYVAYVSSIERFAGELMPSRKEDPEGDDNKEKEGDDKEEENFIAKWIKERTKGCDAWRDLTYIPEPPKIPTLHRPAAAQISNAKASAPNLPTGGATTVAAAQSLLHANSTTNKANNNNNNNGVLMRKAAVSNTTTTTANSKTLSLSMTELARNSIYAARISWQLAQKALNGQISEDLLRTDPLEKLVGTSILVKEVQALLPTAPVSKIVDSSVIKYSDASQSLVIPKEKKKTLREIVDGLGIIYNARMSQIGLFL